MQNRYHGTNPAVANSEELHGRAEAFQMLDNHIQNRRSVVVMGVEGVGKSSLLNCYFTPQYRRQMALEQRMLIRVTDFPTDRDADGIYQYLAEGVLSAVDSLAQAETESVYERLRESCIQKMDECRDSASRFQQVCEKIQDFNYNIMLVIDGFERFVSSPYVKMEHHDLMNTLISKNLSFVVATNYDFNQDSLPATVSGSFLLMKFSGNEIRLKGLSEDAIAALAYPGDFTAEELHQLWILSGGIPSIFRRAAEHAYTMKSNGVTDYWRDVFQETYANVSVLLSHWCKFISAGQIAVLKTLADSDSPRGVAFEEDTLKIAAQALVNRGLLANPIEAGTLRPIPGLFKFNTPLLKRFCKDHYFKEYVRREIWPTLSSPSGALSQENQLSPAASITVNNYNYINSNNTVHNNQQLTVKNIQMVLQQINSKIEPSEFLELLRGDPQRLADRMQKIAEDRLPLLAQPSEGDNSERIEDAVICDIGEKLIGTPSESQREEMEDIFEEIRSDHPELDNILALQLSPECKYCLKAASVVEHRLRDISFSDYSHIGILYGKVLEQSLKDSFFIFLKSNEMFSKKSVNAWGKKLGECEVEETSIGTYYNLLRPRSGYLAKYCAEKNVEASGNIMMQMEWKKWWNHLVEDLENAKSIRNDSGHPNKPEAKVTSTRKDELKAYILGTNGKDSLIERTTQIGLALKATMESDI